MAGPMTLWGIQLGDLPFEISCSEASRYSSANGPYRTTGGDEFAILADFGGAARFVYRGWTEKIIEGCWYNRSSIDGHDVTVGARRRDRSLRAPAISILRIS